MNKKKRYTIWAVLLAVTLILSLGIGYVLAKYTITWERGFGLHIYPKVTEDLSGQPIYFQSNMLRPSIEGVQYDITGVDSWFSLANGLDSHTYSVDRVKYTLSYQVYDETGGVWVGVPALSTTETLQENQYSVVHHEVAPITVGGVTYNKIRVTATCQTGTPVILDAIFVFSYEPIHVTYSYADGVIHMQVTTNEQHGNFTFTWKNGILPDTSDPNLILKGAVASDGTHTAALNAHTVYEFCFFITDAELLAAVTADPAAQMPLAVSLEKAAG